MVVSLVGGKIQTVIEVNAVMKVRPVRVVKTVEATIEKKAV